MLGLTAAITACGGGASTPPEAQTTNEPETASTDGSGSSTDNNTTDKPIDEKPAEAIGEQVAVDLSTPVLCDTDKKRFEEVMLARINAVRAEPQVCGSTNFPAVPSVTWSTKLQTAAELHSVDMTTYNFFSHTGSDGSSVSSRADAQQYEWSAIGENIAAGQNTAQEVVEGWLSSDGHCRNLMNSYYTQIAVACVADDNTDYQRYWTNVLGAPLR